MTNIKKLEKITNKLSNVIGYSVKKAIKKTLTNIKKENRKRKNKDIRKLNRLNKDVNNKLAALEKVQKIKVSKKIKTFKELNTFGIKEEIYQKLRDNRIINEKRDKMVQHPIVPVNTGAQWSTISDNEDLQYVNNNFRKILKDAQKALYDTGNVFNASIQAQYASLGEEIDNKGKVIRSIIGAIKFTSAEKFEKETDTDNNLIFSVESTTSDFQYMFIGYKIIYATRDGTQITKKKIRELKAFCPSSDLKYHKLTASSTTDSKLCIYESFLDIINIRSLRHRRDTLEEGEELKKMLEEEGEEIKKSVINGELIPSLELLTRKYQNTIVIKFYNNNNNLPILVKNGEMIEMKEEELDNYVGKKGMLYNEYHQHVAPFIISKINKDESKKETKKNEYMLRPEDLKQKDYDNLDNRIKKNVLGFDTETWRDNKGDCKLFNITCYGKVYDDDIKYSYYGNQDDCMTNFIDFIKSISTRKNDKKTRPAGKIEDIFIYGFNNSRFDNLLIYERFYEEDPATKFTFSNNSIKKIEYRNIHIFDLSLYYQGNLSKVAEDFNIEEKKGYYPYKFPNGNNLDYVGKIPEKNYFKSDEDYEGCLKELNRNDFNLKEYTVKYCMQDSKLCYEIAVRHLEQCVQVINNKVFDCQKCSTGANIAIKSYVQTFLKSIINQSPEKIIKNERLAYKGGRTEVFKKIFTKTKDDTLYYYDINSSHPFSMCGEMPFKYKFTLKFSEKVFTEKDFIKHNNYFAKVEYIGNDKHYIPNILTRSDEGNIIGCSNTDYSYNWGIELIEAIKCGCKVTVKECDYYESKVIFKDYVEYFYNERQNNKKSNVSKANFYKLLLNSLYGKFGQKKCTRRGIAKVAQEIYDNIGNKKLIDWIDNDNIIIYQYEDDKQHDGIGSLVRFSSYISAVSRSRLAEMMRIIGHEYIYYCDTDSIFTSKEIPKKYLSDSEIGKWKNELIAKDMGDIIKAIFLAPKSYYYKTSKNNEYKKSKSILADKLTDTDYENLLYGNAHSLVQSRDMFFRSFIGVNIHNVDRSVSTIYNKRVWDKNISKPFMNINEWRKVKEDEEMKKKMDKRQHAKEENKQ